MQIDPIVNLRSTLSVFRFGSHDPTTRLTSTDFVRATLTPDGPATLRLRWAGGRLEAEAWGPGERWMLSRAGAMTGSNDAGFRCPDDAHPTVSRAHRNNPGLRIVASSTIYHEILPMVLGQRVTAHEAIGQWRRLCVELGEEAPGPKTELTAGLRLPPSPDRLLAKPAWWFHPFGIEAKRAEALRTVARYADRIGEWSTLAPALAAAKLALLPGIGPWTVGATIGSALGDPDAVAVGDYHIPNMVSWALTRRPRGTDEQMLELLQPYAGQRGRVIRLLAMDGHSAPAFGPHQRIQPVHRW